MEVSIDIFTLASGVLAVVSVITLFIALFKLRSMVKAKLMDDSRFDLLESGLERIERSVRDEFARVRSEEADNAKRSREELRDNLQQFGKVVEHRIEMTRGTVENRLKSLQDDNSAKLEKIRGVVDEKLQATLERKLGQSFKQVGEQLDLVSRGLGEMQALATDVGDLKKVMSNVSRRGTWGEVQLGALLEETMIPGQYQRNVEIKPASGERVEFAIKLPGFDDGGPVWLPIDAKFPTEDYQRLLDAMDNNDQGSIKSAGAELERTVKKEAKKISEKYINPPNSTDFAIMFLPTEGLYAEVIRRPGLFETVRNDHSVALVGPTTLVAVLNSLRMGFQTLAIQKRSGEVWRSLNEVKTEFAKFGEALDKTKKKLKEAGDSIDNVEVRTRAINRKLRDVETLPPPDEE